MKRKPPRQKVETSQIPSGSQGFDRVFGARSDPLPGQRMTEEEMARRDGTYTGPYSVGASPDR